MNPLDEIADLFASEGAADYLGEPVTQAEHMYQAGCLAESADSPPALVAAALLHDVGHFKGALRGHDLMSGTDNHHSQTGASWLAQWFGSEVCDPVRLHVDAKRYLCRAEPEYFAILSAASVYTLSVQGGPMDELEAAEFTAKAYWREAVEVRRFDDQAKEPGVAAPQFDHFRPLLEDLLSGK